MITGNLPEQTAKCAQCRETRKVSDLVTRKIFYRKRRHLVAQDERFCSDKTCGAIYQMALEGEFMDCPDCDRHREAERPTCPDCGADL